MSKDDSRIPLSSVRLSDLEIGYVRECLESSRISSSGKYVALFEEANCHYYTRDHAIAVSSGTAALHLALLSLGIGPGDEVIIPAFTFAATANAVVHCGATPVLADVGVDDWCLDVNSCEAVIGPQTRAIVVVHIYGQPANIEALSALAHAHGLALIEDCAQAHGAAYGGRKVGSFGAVSCFSFYGNKIVTTGEGGLCLTDAAITAEMLRTLRNHGMTSNAPYWHTTVGYNYRMTNLQAAIGLGQMRRVDEIIADRARIDRSYRARLGRTARVSFQKRLAERTAVCWLFSALLEGKEPADAIRRLGACGIEARNVFTPLHRLPPFKDCRRDGDLHVSESIFSCGLSLPCYEGMSEQDIDCVCLALQEALT